MSRRKPKRDALLADLDRAMRMMTAQSVLLSQSVAAIAGINSTDLECLDVIHTKGIASAGELAAATGLTTGAITSVIDRLERAGYVRREAHPSDRRKLLLRLQPAAMQKIAPLYAPLQKEMLSLWSKYDDEQISLVTDFLKKSCQAAERQVAELQSRARANRRHPESGPAAKEAGR
jgi:DNA-binding MarR family transcriptional regulator